MPNRTILRLWAMSTARLDRDERGASLVEYALLLALIAVVCVGAVSVLGDSTGEPYSQLGSRLGE